MSVSNHANIFAKLSKLVTQLQTASLYQQPKPRGRPNMGVRDTYTRLEIYLAPDQVAAIDAIAASRVKRTGRRVPRVDVVREALAAYVRAHSLEAGG